MDIKQSPLVQLATEARRPTPWWLGWIIAFGVGVMGSQLVFGAVRTAFNVSYGTVASQVVELLTNAGTVGVLALWVVFKEGRRFSSIGLTEPRKNLSQLGLGILFGIVMFAIPTGVLMLTGQYQMVATGNRLSGPAALPIVLVLVLVWLVQASTEEMVVRGYLLQVHGRQLPGLAAVLITSIGFAVAHLGASPVALLNITLVALFFTFISLRRGSIWLACGIHTGWNYAQGNLLGIPVSGNAYDTALVFLGPTPGSLDWLTGGQFGIEQSLPALVLLAVLALWSYLDYRKHAAA